MSQISYTKLKEWQAFDRLDPAGGVRADLNAGIIAATIANCHRGKRTKAFVPKDFMPRFEDTKPRRMSDNQIETMIRSFADAHNAALKGGA